jgi:hypothetical protein
MNDFSIAYLLGRDRHLREVLSARPDAPVVPDPVDRPRRGRVRMTGWLPGLAPASRRSSVRLAGPTPCTDC